jgi:hypothetical protein
MQMWREGRDQVREDRGSGEVPDAVCEDYVVVGRPGVGREIGDGERGVEVDAGAQGGGEDVGLSVLEGRGAVVWGAGVDGIW